MAAAVCDKDPRTHEQRRADALGALAHGGDRLVCACDNPDCRAAGVQPSAVVVHVVAEEKSLSDDTPVQLDGPEAPAPTWAELLDMTFTEALTDPRPPPSGPAATPPAALLGGGMLPAPLLAATIAGTARIVPIIHPGNAAPERRYIPSAVLARFVRCRDMTCRFPGCDHPAQHCDIDHTVAYPTGPTQASNLKCLCRKHHLLKTFWGWRDDQHPDGTVDWTSPQGQRYTTHPGSRIQFPTLCRPTAPVRVPTNAAATPPHRDLKMPRRTTTRAQNRHDYIEKQRRLNDDHVAERNKPHTLRRTAAFHDGGRQV
jgi:hypothetical protein